MKIMPNSVRELTQDELGYVNGHLASMEMMFETLFEEPTPVEPFSLDLIFKLWIENFDETKEDPNEVNELLMAFGASFSQAVADELKLVWVMAEFDDEEVFAVCDTSAKIFLYPASLVKNRFDERDTDFFVPLFDRIVEQIQEVRANEKKA